MSCYQRPGSWVFITGSLQHILSIPHLASPRSIYTSLGNYHSHRHERLLLFPLFTQLLSDYSRGVRGFKKAAQDSTSEEFGEQVWAPGLRLCLLHCLQRGEKWRGVVLRVYVNVFHLSSFYLSRNKFPVKSFWLPAFVAAHQLQLTWFFLYFVLPVQSVSACSLFYIYWMFPPQEQREQKGKIHLKQDVRRYEELCVQGREQRFH